METIPPPDVTSLIDIAAQFGLAGLVIFAAGWWIWTMDKKHTERIDSIDLRHTVERKELTDALTRQHSEALTMAERVARSQDNSTAVLSELRTLISNTKR